MRKLVEYILIFALGALCAVGLLFLSYPTIDTTNKWFKVTTDEAIPGEVVILNMNRGYSYSNEEYVILVVKDSEHQDQIVIAFPNGGYWEAPILNPDPNRSVPWQKNY